MDTVGIIPTVANSTSKMAEGIDLYYVPPSPPCRSVLLFAKALGINLNLKFTDITQGEHLTVDFLKINPEHIVPTLDDNGFVLWESRAILCYLANAYDNENRYYPTDPKKRAIVDQRLYFDACNLFKKLAEYFVPIAMQGQPPDEMKAQKFEEALNVLDNILKNSKYVAGDQLSVADFAIIASVSTADVLEMPLSKYNFVMSWYERCKRDMAKYDYEEINEKPAKMLAEMVKNNIFRNKT